MSERAAAPQTRFHSLFLQEEFRGDRLINNIRFYILFVLLGLGINGIALSSVVTSLLYGAVLCALSFRRLARDAAHAPGTG